MGLTEKLRDKARTIVDGFRLWGDSVKVGFEYYLPVRDLDKFLEITQNVKNARYRVETANPDVRVYYAGLNYLGPLRHDFSIYGPDIGSVTKAFGEFIGIAGTPDAIKKNYGIAKNVLNEHNKRLEWRYVGGAGVRFVVDR